MSGTVCSLFRGLSARAPRLYDRPPLEIQSIPRALGGRRRVY
jgi:hypothetical protein